jgi:tellurite resistance protein
MLSKHAALIYVMIMISASDREMKRIELSSIGSIVNRLPAFADYDVGRLPETAAACADTLATENGMNDALDGVAESLPPTLRETAYALALEVAAADRRLNPEELRLLQIIAERLEIDPETASALERSVSVRYAEG